MKYRAFLSTSLIMLLSVGCLSAGGDEGEKEVAGLTTQTKNAPQKDPVEEFSDCLQTSNYANTRELAGEYPSLQKEFQIEFFHHKLYLGDVKTIKKFLRNLPRLAQKPNHFGVGPVVSALNTDKIKESKKILALLKKYGADFNWEAPIFGERPCVMTPLAECLWKAPNYDEFIAPLIRYGADAFHPSVDQVISVMSKNIYRMERPRFGARPTIDKFLVERGGKPLPPYYETNSLALSSPAREEKPKIDEWCPRLASELMPFHYPRRIAGLRYGAGLMNHLLVNAQGNSLYVYTEVQDLKNPTRPYNNTEMYELEETQPQKLILSVLMGEQYPADVFTFLRQLVDSDLERTVLGRLLYASIGHDEYMSMKKIAVIDDQLANSIAEKMGYTSGDGIRIEKELYDAIKPCRFSALSLVNNFSPQENTFCSYIQGDSRNALLHYPPMKIFSIGIESEGAVLSKMCIVLKRLDERVAPGPFYFTSNIAAKIVGKVLLGEESPWFYDKLLRESIGPDYVGITGLGRFFDVLHGFPEFIGSFGKAQVVDDQLAAQLRKSLGMES